MDIKKAFAYSLKSSIPIFISFLPVGLAYGIVMRSAGYSWVWSGLCSLTVFAGSLQFLMVSFLQEGTSLLTVTVTALLLNSRHIFYGIPFIETWKNYGPRKLFLIYALPDEAFSLHCANDFEDGSSRDKMLTYVFSAALILLYWVVLSMLGGLVGAVLPFNTEGIDFALTALFIVITLEQLRDPVNRLPALMAVASAAVCLLVLGPDSFLLPSLTVTVVLLYIIRDRHAEEGEGTK